MFVTESTEVAPRARRPKLSALWYFSVTSVSKGFLGQLQELVGLALDLAEVQRAYESRQAELHAKIHVRLKQTETSATGEAVEKIVRFETKRVVSGKAGAITQMSRVER